MREQVSSLNQELQKWQSIFENNVWGTQVHAYPSSEGLSVYLRDIHDRKSKERAQEEEKKRLYSLLDGLPAAIFLQDRQFKIHFANKKFIELFGPLEGRTCYQIIEDSRTPCDDCHTVTMTEDSDPVYEIFSAKDKTYELYQQPYVDYNGTLLIAKMLIDVTEKKKTETEIVRLQSLNLVGEMAAGIAHEIRNPLTSVRGFLQMLSSKQEQNKYRDFYDLMVGELDRANSIITEFLSLAKGSKSEKKRHNLGLILTNLYPLILVDALNQDKEVVFELENIPDLMLDQKEIRQLILNLVRNGLEAMTPGGKLCLRTYLEKEKIVLAVQDHGGGMDEATLKNLGTPFFTTKEKGTGLGLAICYSIASRHNANISAQSGPEGTTFFVKFGL